MKNLIQITLVIDYSKIIKVYPVNFPRLLVAVLTRKESNPFGNLSTSFFTLPISLIRFPTGLPFWKRIIQILKLSNVQIDKKDIQFLLLAVFPEFWLQNDLIDAGGMNRETTKLKLRRNISELLMDYSFKTFAEKNKLWKM